MMQSLGVLLLAHGGPNSPDDVPAYLRNIRGAQPVPQSMIDETTRRYRMIGGFSPLCNITRRLASNLQQTIDLPVYIGMRHWHPYVEDAVREMVRDGIEYGVAICLAPHYSALSIGAYRAKLDQAISESYGAAQRSSFSTPTVDFIEAWHAQPHFIQGVAQNVQTALAQLPAETKIIFTAHSLPTSAREPHETQLRETAQLIARQLGLADERWMLAYQGAPRTNSPWLGPQIEQLVPQLARDGEKSLVIAPIGFIAEHLEVLYDLDIALQATARANNIHVVRTPMLNDSPALVAALADLVRARIGVKI